MFFLFLVGCLILLPIWGSHSKTALTEYKSKRQKNLSVEQYRKDFSDDILVTTADGYLHKLNSHGIIIWSSPIQGGSLVSSFHPLKKQEHKHQSDKTFPRSIDSSHSGTMIPSVRGSVLSYIGEELQSLDISVEELVNQTPKLSSDGTLFLGSKQSTVFGVDTKDGSMIDMSEITDESSKAWFVRVDYLVKAIEAESGIEMWNFTFSAIVPFEEMNDAELDREVDDDDELLNTDSSRIVSELRVFADGSLLKQNGRGDSSLMLNPDLPSSIASAFLMKEKYEKKSKSGVLYLPQEGDEGGDKTGAVSLKQLDIKHHLLSSSSANIESQSTVVAQIESITTHEDYLSLFAVEYLANFADLQDSRSAITASPSKCCLLEKFLGSPGKGLPALPSRSGGNTKRKDLRIAGSPTKLMIGDINQSTLVSRPTNQNIKKTYESDNIVRGVSEDRSVCLKGNSNYPECMIGLHLLENSSSSLTNDDEEDDTHSSPYSTKRHQKSSHVIVVALIMLGVLVVTWCKDHHHLLTQITTAAEALVRNIFSPSQPQNGTMDADGNLVVGNLRLSEEKLGHGSMGTIVFRGSLDGRPVAVKRMLCDYHAAAAREMKLLIESDGHPNVVRYFVQETQGHFVYLALELCAMSLHEAMEKIQANSTKKSRSSSVAHEPSVAVSGAMLDIVKGVAFLHKQRIVHRDIKPHNILLAPRRSFTRNNSNSLSKVRASLESVEDLDQFTLKISDMGLGKLWLPGQSESLGRKNVGRSTECSGYNTSGSVHGTVGWQAPEIVTTSLKQSSPTKKNKTQSSNWARACSADIFSLGCVLFHVLEPGDHLFGENWFERESNIVHNKPIGLDKLQCSTAHLLVKRMTNQCSELRPSAEVVELHPIFWNQVKKMNFLNDISDMLELEQPASNLLLSIEKGASEVFGASWRDRIDECLIEDATKFRSYDVGSVRALLRVIRNKRNHWHELPPSMQSLVSSKSSEPFPGCLMGYFEERFPQLLHHCYQATEGILNQDASFIQYFGDDPSRDCNLETVIRATTITKDAPPLEEVEEVDSPPPVSPPMSEMDIKTVSPHKQEETAKPLEQYIDETRHLGRGWSQPLDQWQQDRLPGPLPPALERSSIDPKYRTRLCQHWDSTQGTCCPMLAKGKCDFAHGPIEIRVKETKLHKWGSCTIKGVVIPNKQEVSDSRKDGAETMVIDHDDNEESTLLLQSGTSGGEDTYGAAKNVERIRKVDGKDEVEKQKLKKKKTPSTNNRKPHLKSSSKRNQ